MVVRNIMCVSLASMELILVNYIKNKEYEKAILQASSIYRNDQSRLREKHLEILNLAKSEIKEDDYIHLLKITNLTDDKVNIGANKNVFKCSIL